MYVSVLGGGGGGGRVAQLIFFPTTEVSSFIGKCTPSRVYLVSPQQWLNVYELLTTLIKFSEVYKLTEAYGGYN